MSSLFSSLKEKAQSAVNSSGLAGHIPGSFGRTDGAESPPPGQSSGGIAGITKSHAFESLHHQLRTFQQQYSSSTTPVQKIITSSKGIAIDFDNVSRDSQAYSKELFMWGQTDDDDIKDVSDRLAWLSYVQGSLSGEVATKIDASRITIKQLRDAENALAPRRNIRVGLQNQISRIEHDQRKEQQPRLRELQAQLRKNEEEDQVAEKDIAILKRKALRESEQQKWEAVREYAEKLSMVAQAALNIVPVLPPVPPSKASPYSGAQTTASVRASLQKALDNYSPGNINLILAAPTASDLKHTRSFGETHSKELSRIGTQEPSITGNIPITPPPFTATAPPPNPTHSPTLPSTSPNVLTSPSRLSHPIPLPVGSQPSSVATAPSPSNMSPPLNPANLNQAPAPIPTSISSTTSPIVAPDPSDPAIKVPSVTPTVAETGVPQSAGPDGPGPSSGSLLNKHATSPKLPNPFDSSSKFESAEDEKRRLEREERERLLHGEGGTPHYESAEEEKKRLEREEREKVLRGDHPSNPPGPNHPGDDDSELPPYQEI